MYDAKLNACPWHRCPLAGSGGWTATYRTTNVDADEQRADLKASCMLNVGGSYQAVCHLMLGHRIPGNALGCSEATPLLLLEG